MIIVIDGYNLLKLIHGTTVSEMQRSAFVSLMGRYMKKRSHKVIIVFDAGPCVYPLKEKNHGVQIVFSGEYQTADDIIIKFVQDNSNKDVVVITRDREIITHIEKSNKEALDPLEFYNKVRAVFAPSEQQQMQKEGMLRKFSQEESPYLDALMREAASMHMPDKDVFEYTVERHHEPKGNDLSKKQRARLKALDKL